MDNPQTRREILTAIKNGDIRLEDFRIDLQPEWRVELIYETEDSWVSIQAFPGAVQAYSMPGARGDLLDCSWKEFQQTSVDELLEGHRNSGDYDETDTMAVFADGKAQLDASDRLVLLARLEVPRYTRPEKGATELTQHERQSLAVQWAVTSHFDTDSLSALEGEEFAVMDELAQPMAFIEFGRNPPVAGCWNPNEK